MSNGEAKAPKLMSLLRQIPVRSPWKENKCYHFRFHRIPRFELSNRAKERKMKRHLGTNPENIDSVFFSPFLLSSSLPRSLLRFKLVRETNFLPNFLSGCIAAMKLICAGKLENRQVTYYSCTASLGRGCVNVFLLV